MKLIDDLPPLDRTAWMSSADRPAHEGVYERAFPGGPFACWNGQTWNADAASIDEAAAATEASRYQRLSWRGLVDPPERPCATCKGHTVVDRGLFEGDEGEDRIVECPDC